MFEFIIIFCNMFMFLIYNKNLDVNHRFIRIDVYNLYTVNHI